MNVRRAATFGFLILASSPGISAQADDDVIDTQISQWGSEALVESSRTVRAEGIGPTRPDALAHVLAELTRNINSYQTAVSSRYVPAADGGAGRPSVSTEFAQTTKLKNDAKFRFGQVLVSSLVNDRQTDDPNAGDGQSASAATKVEWTHGNMSFVLKQYMESISLGTQVGRRATEPSEEIRLEMHGKGLGFNELMAELKRAGLRFKEREEEGSVLIGASYELTEKAIRDFKVWDAEYIKTAESERQLEVDAKVRDYIRENAENAFDELSADLDKEKPQKRGKPKKKGR